MNQQKHLLLVEDEAISALYISNALKIKNFSVDFVATGENALKCISENMADLIIMDIQLAGKINGIDAARKILKSYDIPIIFITGYPNKEYSDMAKKLAPLAYLIKPINIDDICHIIETYFKEKH